MLVSFEQWSSVLFTRINISVQWGQTAVWFVPGNGLNWDLPWPGWLSEDSIHKPDTQIQVQVVWAVIHMLFIHLFPFTEDCNVADWATMLQLLLSEERKKKRNQNNDKKLNTGWSRHSQPSLQTTMMWMTLNYISRTQLCGVWNECCANTVAISGHISWNPSNLLC